jgi:hypothetical protein
MSLNKTLNLLLIVTSLAYGLLFAILLLGYLFPGEPGPDRAPWFVWAAVGEVVMLVTAGLIACFVVRRRSRKRKEQLE